MSSTFARLRRRSASRGFTLVELLTVIGVIGILAALTMPAVQHARESARRAHCLSNLRQIGLAVVQYEDVHRTFPIGRRPEHDPRYAGNNPPCSTRTIDRSFLVAILPYTEVATLADSMNHALSAFGLENVTVHRRPVAYFVCPSDPDASESQRLIPAAGTFMADLPPPASGWRIGLSSYAGNYGAFFLAALPAYHGNCMVPQLAIRQCNGLLTDVAPIRWRDLLGGASSTVLASEKASSSIRTYDGVGQPDGYLAWWVSGNLNATLYTAFYPPNAMLTRFGGDRNAREVAASSFHPQGVNLLLADGSARFVNENVDSWGFSDESGLPHGIAGDHFAGWTNVPKYGVWQRLADRTWIDRTTGF